MAQGAALGRPTLVQPRAVEQLEAVRSVTGGGFDVDAWHVMDRRDDELVADEVLNGAGSSAFVYSFEINRTPVVGVSVVGARHLANHYRGLKHRLVASMQKTGELFVFTSYPAEGMPMSVSCAVVHELAGEPDFYSAVVELSDIKTGNAIQIERREDRIGYDRNSQPYERPNYTTIAQSKAYRNAVLALVPQDVVILWRENMLKLRKGETITGGVLAEKRSNVIRFAAQHAIALERHAVEGLTLDQIAGLGDAAREGRLPAFVNAARALGLEVGQGEVAETPAQQQQSETPAQPRRGPGRPRRASGSDDRPAGDTPPPGPTQAPPQGDPPGQAPQGDPPPDPAAAARRLNLE